MPATVWGRFVSAVRHDGRVSHDLTSLPDYSALLADFEAQVHALRLTAQQAADTALLHRNWSIDDAIHTRQAADSWGAKGIDRLTADLHVEFPEMTSPAGTGEQGTPRRARGFLRTATS